MKVKKSPFGNYLWKEAEGWNKRNGFQLEVGGNWFGIIKYVEYLDEEYIEAQVVFHREVLNNDTFKLNICIYDIESEIDKSI